MNDEKVKELMSADDTEINARSIVRMEGRVGALERNLTELSGIVKDSHEKTMQEIRGLHGALSGMGKTTWPLTISIVGVTVMMLIAITGFGYAFSQELGEAKSNIAHTSVILDERHRMIVERQDADVRALTREMELDRQAQDRRIQRLEDKVLTP